MKYLPKYQNISQISTSKTKPQLREICTNYLVGLTMETRRKELPKATAEEQRRYFWQL